MHGSAVSEAVVDLTRNKLNYVTLKIMEIHLVLPKSPHDFGL